MSNEIAVSLAEHSLRGPYAVGVSTIMIDEVTAPSRILPVDVWYPAMDQYLGEDLDTERQAVHLLHCPHLAVADASPREGRFPLLVFSHGNSGIRQQSTFLTTHLASWGFVVAAPDHVGNTFADMFELGDEERKAAHFEARRNRPRDIGRVIDRILRSDPDLPGIESQKIGTLGHSYGGWSAVKTAALDSRIRSVVGLAPASEPFVGRKAFAPGELPLSDSVPVLLVAAVDDVLVDFETSVLPLFQRMSSASSLYLVDNADHFHFCDGIEMLHSMHLNTPRPNLSAEVKNYVDVLPESRMHRILQGLVTTFFQTTLRDGESSLASANLSELDPALNRFEPARIDLGSDRN